MSGLPFKRPLKSPIEAWCWIIYHAPIETTQRDLAKEWGWPAPKVQRLIEKWKSDAWIDANGSRAGTKISLGIYAPLPNHALGHRGKIDAKLDAPQEDLLGHKLEGVTTRRMTKTALTEAFKFPPEWIDAAEAIGMPRQRAREAAYEWRNYWIGRGDKKANWKTTWLNRVKEVMRRDTTRAAPPQSSMVDAMLDDLD